MSMPDPTKPVHVAVETRTPSNDRSEDNSAMDDVEIYNPPERKGATRAIIYALLLISFFVGTLIFGYVNQM